MDSCQIFGEFLGISLRSQSNFSAAIGQFPTTSLGHRQHPSLMALVSFPSTCLPKRKNFQKYRNSQPPSPKTKHPSHPLNQRKVSALPTFRWHSTRPSPLPRFPAPKRLHLIGLGQHVGGLAERLQQLGIALVHLLRVRRDVTSSEWQRKNGTGSKQGVERNESKSKALFVLMFWRSLPF